VPLNVLTLPPPRSPAEVTVRISLFAHVAGCEAEAAETPAGTAAKHSSRVTRRRPTTPSHRPRSRSTLISCDVDLEITPEPMPEERAAIEAALADEPQDPPTRWREDLDEP
jgi:hypothetical protein